MTHNLGLLRQPPKGQACDHRDICTEPAYKFVKRLGWLCKRHHADHEARVKYFADVDDERIERLR